MGPGHHPQECSPWLIADDLMDLTSSAEELDCGCSLDSVSLGDARLMEHVEFVELHLRGLLCSHGREVRIQTLAPDTLLVPKVYGQGLDAARTTEDHSAVVTSSTASGMLFQFIRDVREMRRIRPWRAGSHLVSLLGVGLQFLWASEGHAAGRTGRALRRRRCLGAHAHRAMLAQLRLRGELHSTCRALELLCEGGPSRFRTCRP